MWAPWLVLLAPATALPSTPKLALPELSKLAPLVGVWESRGIRSHCDWSPDHRWLICDQFGGSEGEKFDAISMYSYSPKRNAMIFYTMPDGQPLPFSATLKIEGKRWTYIPVDPQAAKHFRTINEFQDADHYTWQALGSDDDGKTWKAVMTGESTRVK